MRSPLRSSLGSLSLGVLVLVAGCQRLHASRVPLGGVHEEEPSEPERVAKLEPPLEAAPPASSVAPPPAPEQPATPPAAPSAAATTAPSAVATAFQVRPYAAHQTWTRIFDLEFSLRMATGVDMKMTSHQEARFEVLAASAGSIDQLAIEYLTYTSKMTIMGNSQDSPEELAGKRFVVSFSHGKPDVRDAGGKTPPKKQVDSVKDDAREPLEIEKALHELSQLSSKGRGDFTAAGAVALAGGEDEDTKVTHAKASLVRIAEVSGSKQATLDLGYTLTNQLDDGSVVQAEVAGTLSVLDAPARYQSSVLEGPMEIQSAQAGGMPGRGTLKVTTSYKY